MFALEQRRCRVTMMTSATRRVGNEREQTRHSARLALAAVPKQNIVSLVVVIKVLALLSIPLGFLFPLFFSFSFAFRSFAFSFRVAQLRVALFLLPDRGTRSISSRFVSCTAFRAIVVWSETRDRSEWLAKPWCVPLESRRERILLPSNASSASRLRNEGTAMPAPLQFAFFSTHIHRHTECAFPANGPIYTLLNLCHTSATAALMRALYSKALPERA